MAYVPSRTWPQSPLNTINFPSIQPSWATLTTLSFGPSCNILPSFHCRSLCDCTPAPSSSEHLQCGSSHSPFTMRCNPLAQALPSCCFSLPWHSSLLPFYRTETCLCLLGIFHDHSLLEQKQHEEKGLFHVRNASQAPRMASAHSRCSICVCEINIFMSEKYCLRTYNVHFRGQRTVYVA